MVTRQGPLPEELRRVLLRMSMADLQDVAEFMGIGFFQDDLDDDEMRMIIASEPIRRLKAALRDLKRKKERAHRRPASIGEKRT